MRHHTRTGRQAAISEAASPSGRATGGLPEPPMYRKRNTRKGHGRPQGTRASSPGPYKLSKLLVESLLQLTDDTSYSNR